MEASLDGHNGTKTASNNSRKGTKETKQKRHYGVLQPMSNSGDMNKADYSALVDKTPVEWRALKNYEMFSLSPDGLFPMMKVSRNKAVRLHDRNVEMVSGGRCHRILVSSH